MNWVILSPLILSLILIWITRRVMISLLSGFLLGALILKWGSLGSFFPYLFESLWSALKNPWHYSALIFTALLGGFAALLKEGGGLSRLFSSVSTKRDLELRTIGLGALCFFDGLASGVIIARVVRPVADRVRLSREKVAYLADTTSSAVACLAPVSTWIAMQLGLIGGVLEQRGLELSPYTVFLKSIPLNFYCLLSLVLALGLALTGFDYSTMKKAEPTANSATTPPQTNAKLAPALIGIIILLLSIPTLYYVLEAKPLLPVSYNKIITALGSGGGPVVFILAGLISVIALILLTTQIPFKHRLTTTGKGIGMMLPPLLVLLAAWLFGSVMKDLGLANQLSALLGDHFSIRTLPVIIFLLGCLLSFTTGTSWGTMALLFPLAFGLLDSVETEQLLAVMPLIIASIFSGSVFGDHCSPYSDTTIVSAAAAGCSAYDHVKTQLPYALSAGAVAALFFTFAGFLTA